MNGVSQEFEPRCVRHASGTGRHIANVERRQGVRAEFASKHVARASGRRRSHHHTRITLRNVHRLSAHGRGNRVPPIVCPELQSDGARRASPYIMVARARQGMGAKMGEEPV